MLTGRHVFDAPGAMQIMARHIQTAPSPPSMYSPFRVPQALDAIVLDCLAKRPAERPSSARELADRLTQCQMESPWTREDAMGWWETRLEPERAVALSD
jgi:serine/threonine-protein kinase